MSYQSWHFYGFGINFSDFDIACDRMNDPITPVDVERLLENAPALRSEVHAWLDELRENDPAHVVDINDYRDFDQDYGLEIARIFAEVISEAEGLTHVYAASDYNNDHYVIFGQGYPWNMNEKEKNFREEDVVKIFCKYLSILKPGTQLGRPLVEITDQAIEDGG